MLSKEAKKLLEYQEHYRSGSCTVALSPKLKLLLEFSDSFDHHVSIICSISGGQGGLLFHKQVTESGLLPFLLSRPQWFATRTKVPKIISCRLLLSLFGGMCLKHYMLNSTKMSQSCSFEARYSNLDCITPKGQKLGNHIHQGLLKIALPTEILPCWPWTWHCWSNFNFCISVQSKAVIGSIWAEALSIVNKMNELPTHWSVEVDYQIATNLDNMAFRQNDH